MTASDGGPHDADPSDDDPSDDAFGGAWLVTEYVHDPDGTFVGTISQRRTVAQLDSGRLRVTQQCEPASELAGHAMAAFAGEWVFDLEVRGAKRHYLGPDVIGVGTQWVDGAMTGEGVWPRFGHEFTSYGVLVADDRQLTGGSFALAGRSVADIVGVAVPEAAGTEPVLDLAAEPGEIDGAQVARRVGPMRLGIVRRSPTTTLWAATMSDPIGGVELRIQRVTTDDGTTTGEVTIRPSP